MSNINTRRHDRPKHRENPSFLTKGKLLGATVVTATVGYGAINQIQAERPLAEARVQMEVVNQPHRVIHIGDVVHETDADGDYLYRNLDSIAVSAQRHNPELAGVDRDALVAFLKKQNGIEKKSTNLPIGLAIKFPAEWGIGKLVQIPGDSAERP